MISRKTLSSMMFASVLALGLAACGEKDAGSNVAAGAEPVAAVAAPAGTSWVDTVTETPEGNFVLGNPNAPIKLVEFASYTCSHCAEFSEQSHEELKKDFIASGKVSFELRNYVRDPLDMSIALLARCSGKDAYYGLSEQYFTNQAPMFEAAQAMGDAAYEATMSAPPTERFVRLAQATGLIEFAKQRGIAEDQAKQCLADTKTADALAKGVEDANATYKISGTPTLLINNTVVENTTTWQAIKAKLREAGA